MAAKAVRLTNSKGVTVVTTDAVAARLSGFEAEKKAPAKKPASSDDK